MRAGQRVRLELDQRGASALHAALAETLGGGLLSGDRRDAARELLEQLEGKVPDWLSCAPVGGEAGYLIAAEAVVRALVDAEDRGRSSLVEIELLHALGDAKPLGASAGEVLTRMRREQLIRAQAGCGEERRWTAAPAGRRFLHRDTAAREDAWAVGDADGLLDLIYAEHHPDMRAHRPSVQAIGRLEDAALMALLDELQAAGKLNPEKTDRRWIELSWDGYELARSRWRQSAPGQRVTWTGPPAPPRPYRRELPILIAREDRVHPSRWDDEPSGAYCTTASWLQRSSKTKLWATLRRDGATRWSCPRCESHWLVYLEAHTRDDQPAYRDPAAATHNRPAWRPSFKA
jgi:hypothetical protein